MPELEKTSRGFTVFARVPTQRGGSVRVQESSSMGGGAHVWIFLDGEQCVEHLGNRQKPDPYFNVEQARQLAAALNAFCDAAEANELTEPA